MLDTTSVEGAIGTLKHAQSELRTALGKAAGDSDVNIQRVKELTNYHEQVGNLARELEHWQKSHTPEPIKVTPKVT